MAEGAVFDLGYHKHEGERLGRSGAVRALLRDGVRRVLGLRRRARKKVLPIILMSIALLPAAFFVAFGVVAGELDVTAELFGHSEYFNLTGVIALIFIALASAELLVPDRLHGTLQVYASRPLSTTDYLAGRAGAMAALVLGFMWLPHVVLFIGRAWVSNDGFASYAADHWQVLWKTAAASGVYLLAFAPIGLVIAAIANRPSVAAGAIMGVIMVSGATEALIDSGGFEPLALLALRDNPGYVKDWLLDPSASWIPERAGYEPIASLAVIVLIAAGCWVVLVQRYRRLR